MVLAKVAYLLASDRQFNASFRQDPEPALAERGLALDAVELSIVRAALDSGNMFAEGNTPDVINTPWLIALNHAASVNLSAV